jgi:hypothetical protein
MRERIVSKKPTIKFTRSPNGPGGKSALPEQGFQIICPYAESLGTELGELVEEGEMTLEELVDSLEEVINSPEPYKNRL